MILLADENIDQSIVAKLRLYGHEVPAVAELEPSLSDDRVSEPYPSAIVKGCCLQRTRISAIWCFANNAFPPA